MSKQRARDPLLHELHRIPVVVLSTSSSPGDVADAYDRHANAYVCKPTQFGERVDLMSAICDFWLGAVALPSA